MNEIWQNKLVLYVIPIHSVSVEYLHSAQRTLMTYSICESVNGGSGIHQIIILSLQLALQFIIVRSVPDEKTN